MQQLHEALRDLGNQLGQSIFSDADTLRGALDDFLDEESADTGQINLLVDAVRLGGVARLINMLDGGADPTLAIEESGRYLAKQRGTEDLGGSRWACAAVGFALGRVGDAHVQQTRSRPNPSVVVPPPDLNKGPGQPTGGTGGVPGDRSGISQQPPPSFPQQPQPQQPPQFPQQPAQFPQPQPQQPAFSNNPGFPPRTPEQPTWTPAQPPRDPGRGNGTKIAAAIAAVVVLLGLIGGGTYLLTKGDDGKDKKTTDSTSAPTSQDVTSGPPVLETDLESVAERYSSLGSNLTADMTECTAETPQTGQTELVRCSYDQGSIVLTTYSAITDLRAARNGTISYEKGTRLSENQPSGIFFSHQIEGGDATLYWDDTSALQSGLIEANSGVDIADVDTLFKTLKAAVQYPEKPEDSQLKAFADEFSMVKCYRIQTLDAGEREEAKCSGKRAGPAIFYLVKSKSLLEMRNYRRGQIDLSDSNNGTDSTWQFGEGAIEGRYARYVDSDGNAYIYWDQEKCRCYLIGVRTDGNLDALTKWWPTA